MLSAGSPALRGRPLRSCRPIESATPARQRCRGNNPSVTPRIGEAVAAASPPADVSRVDLRKEDAVVRQAMEGLVKALVQRVQAKALGSSLETLAELHKTASATQTAAGETQAGLSRVEERLEAMEQLEITQTLQWAISNATEGEFQYNQKGVGQRGSASAVKWVLGGFMERRGTWIDLDRGIGNGSQEPTDAQRQAYNSALSAQIHRLTGVKPRVDKKMNGDKEQCAIYRQ